jgi:hypothetical protein
MIYHNGKIIPLNEYFDQVKKTSAKHFSEVKAETVATLPPSKDLTVSEIKTELKKKGLSTKGKKEELTKRLENA